ncbi:unnamed protein product [Ixodes hexagonus]
MTNTEIKESKRPRTLGDSLKTSLFYGGSPKHSPIIDKVKRRVSKLEKASCPVQFRGGISGPTVIWKVFPVQSEALSLVRKMPWDVRVFSFELKDKDATGKRGFLVTHPLHLWKVLKMRRPSDRCMYEVIAEDAPCKLYLDLEFETEANPGRDGAAMVKELIDVVCREWQTVFGAACQPKDVLWLDSSTEKKFSSHLVFQRMQLFHDNREAGTFVRLICEKLRSRASLEAAQSCGSPFVTSRHGETVLFIDEGVYTRNRNFRLFQCTKLRKNVPLVVSENDEYVRSLGADYDEQNIFLDSLVTWCPPTEEPDRLLQFTRPRDNTRRNLGTRALEKTFRNVSSPYPELDDFISGLIAPRGSIRYVTFFPDTDMLVYDITGYRFCENVGREHRSNGVMLVADVQVGMYYQKCYDPDCRAISFRSTPRPIPEHCLPSYWLNMVPDELLRGDGAS